MVNLADLARTLLEVQRADLDYPVRTPLVYLALHQASALGLVCGVKPDPAEPGWPVIYIDLPTGQVSWHCQEYPASWDNHTTAEKFDRITSFASRYL